MEFQESFSRRNNYGGAAKEITIREEAPESLRVTVLETARQLNWVPSALRTVLCRVLRVRPYPGNWSEYPNIWDEAQSLMYDCEWFKVYDIIEALCRDMAVHDYQRGGNTAHQFAATVNAFFVEEGIGWQLVNGQIVTRGAEAFESVTKEAATALQNSGRPTAATHLHEALQDMSRRPAADLSGAVYHAMGAMECVARDLCGDPKATLGEILKSYPALLPRPLDTALSQIWGFASNEARHVVEGRNPSREEAELLVGLSAAIATYLVRKGSPPQY
jgi:AbiJ N-terminal domain 4